MDHPTSRDEHDDASPREEGAPLRGGERGFSIAFAYGGLLVGGFAWILYWGAANLPARGESSAEWRPDAISVLDGVLLLVLPVAAFFVFGRYGRRWMP